MQENLDTPDMKKIIIIKVEEKNRSAKKTFGETSKENRYIWPLALRQKVQPWDEIIKSDPIANETRLLMLLNNFP